jgi:UDP-N-acetylmuramoyl-tripeptide--D-alanyl-D-alanine ligase
VVPAGAELLAPHLREELRTLTFGPGGDVSLEETGGAEAHEGLRIRLSGPAARGAQETITLRPSFSQAYNVANLLAAVAAARALDFTPEGDLHVSFSALRGERLALGDGVALLNDCYNANPMSMAAALDDLAETAAGRRVAVLGDMLELGPDAVAFHRDVGAHAAARGVQLLVTVGVLAGHMADGFPGEVHRVSDARAAADLLGGLLRPGDTVLVKGSRGVGLEHVAEALGARPEAPGAPIGTELAAGRGRR